MDGAVCVGNAGHDHNFVSVLPLRKTNPKNPGSMLNNNSMRGTLGSKFMFPNFWQVKGKEINRMKYNKMQVVGYQLMVNVVSVVNKCATLLAIPEFQVEEKFDVCLLPTVPGRALPGIYLEDLGHWRGSGFRSSLITRVPEGSDQRFGSGPRSSCYDDGRGQTFIWTLPHDQRTADS